MITEALKYVFARMDHNGGDLKEFKDPNTGDWGGYVLVPDGFKKLDVFTPAHYRFPQKVRVANLESLVKYMRKFSAGETVVVTCNPNGLFVEMEYSLGGAAGRREHSVIFPAAYDDEHLKAGKALDSVIGRWIGIGQVESFIDLASEVIIEAAVLQDVVLNMEGVTKVAKAETKTGTSVTVTRSDEVKSAFEIPKQVSFRLKYMGSLIELTTDLRIKLANGEIMFLFRDTGALDAQKIQIARLAAAKVAEEFEHVTIIDGSLA